MPDVARPSRRRSPDARREQLLDAAETVLLDRGLAASTVADVAEAAGVAKGTVYLYFDSKDALLAGLRARYLGRFADAVEGPVRPGRASVLTRLQRFVDGLFDFSVRNQALHHLLFHEAGFSEEDAFAGARSLLEGLLAEGTAEGAFDVRDPAVSASFLLHGLHGVLVEVLHAGPERRRHAAATARQLVRNTVAPMKLDTG